MKKFLLCVMIFVLGANLAFAGVDPYVYVDIDNVEIASGGNSAVGGSFNVDVVKSNEYLALSKSGHSFADVYAHKKFKGSTGDKTSEYYLSQNYPKASRINIRPKGKQVAQIKSKSVPSKKVLLNANAPILITSYIDKVILTFGRDGGDLCNADFINVLDDKGKVITTLQGLATRSYNDLNENHFVEVKVTPQYKNYYLEIKDHDTKKFYYVLLKIKSTDYPAKENKDLTYNDNISEEDHNSNKEVINQYMRDHNIKDEASLKDQDYEAIVEIMKAKQYEDAKPIDQKMMNAMNGYMKKHGIEDITNMTEKDFEAMNQDFLKSLTPEEMKKLEARDKVMDDYMKKHSITDATKLSPKDMKEINKEIEKTLGKEWTY